MKPNILNIYNLKPNKTKFKKKLKKINFLIKLNIYKIFNIFETKYIKYL